MTNASKLSQAESDVRCAETSYAFALIATDCGAECMEKARKKLDAAKARLRKLKRKN